MQVKPHRVAVDLTAFPDLIVVYLGFQVSTWRGLLAILGIGRGLELIRRDKPERAAGP